MTDKENQELQKTLAEMESWKKQLETLVQQSMVVEKAVMELNSTIELLDQLKKNKKGAELLVPIGGNNFIKATLADTETVLAGVGAGISVEKKVDDTIASIKNRADYLGKTLARLRENAVRINDRVEELGGTIREMVEQSNAKK